MLIHKKTFLLPACIALILITWQFDVSANIGVKFFWMQYIFPVAIAILGPLIVYFATGVDKYIKTKSEKRFEEGLKAYDEKNYPKAVRKWRPLADKGYADAQCRIAMMYEEGICLIKDNKKAEEWHKKAAKRGHDLSQARLGYMHSVRENYKEAKKWYEKSEKKGNPEGINNLGLIYYHGLGEVVQNYDEAFKLFMQAADLGLATAQNNIGGIYYDGTINVKQNHEEALRWFRQAARQGDMIAQRNLGMMYFIGEGGLEQNFSHAYKWFYLARKQGDEISQPWLDAIDRLLAKEKIAKAIAMAEKCIETNYEECGE